MVLSYKTLIILTLGVFSLIASFSIAYSIRSEEIHRLENMVTTHESTYSAQREQLKYRSSSSNSATDHALVNKDFALHPSLTDHSDEEFKALLDSHFHISQSGFGNVTSAIYILKNWAETAPLSAINYCTKNKNASLYIPAVISSWAQVDEASATQWVEANSPCNSHENYQRNLIEGIAEHSTTRATQKALELPTQTQRANALYGVVAHVTEGGATQVEHWLKSLNDNELSSQMTACIMESLYSSNPQEAEKWIQMIGPNNSLTRSTAIHHYVTNLTWSSPDTAENWITQLPEQERKNALLSFVSTFAQTDTYSAADWLDSNSAHKNYQELLHNFSLGASIKDPIFSLNYAIEIESVQHRQEALTQALNTIERAHPEKLPIWLEENELPSEFDTTIERILNQLQ